MKRKQALPEAAAEITHTAADRAEEFVDAAMKKIAPLIEQAGDQIGPLASDAKKKTAAFASTQMDKAQPAIEDALDKIVTDLLPKLQDGLRNAADLPVVGDDIEKFADRIPTSKRQVKKLRKETEKKAEQARKDAKKLAKKAGKRGQSAIAALKGEIEVAPKRNKAGKVVGTLAVATALVGAAAVLLRRYLNQTDESGWAAHEPSMAYASHDEDSMDQAKDKAAGFMADAKDKAQDIASDVKDKAQDLTAQAKDRAADLADAAKDKTEDLKDSIDDGVEAAKDKADDVADAAKDKVEETKDYGPGSFIGEHAPEGFRIKGNERSMKYHVEGTEGYERTIPDVWFESEEAAEAAGFSKAQR